MQSIMEDGEHAIQIDTKDSSTQAVAASWVHRVNGELNRLSESRSEERKRWAGESIYRVPWNLKKLCIGAYHPQTVSIGPYHYGTKNLKPMEKHKHRAFLNFVDRNKKPLQCYVDALAQKTDELMGAYDQLQPKWKQDTEGFLRLMLVDGCFILEVIQSANAGKVDLGKMGYAPSDPVFSTHAHLYLGPFLRRDMLMLENQIPMQVLNVILVVANGSKDEELNQRVLKFFLRPDKPKECSIRKLLDKCFSRQTKSTGGTITGIALPPSSRPPPQTQSGDREIEDDLHILDLYRKSQLLGHTKKRRKFWPKGCASEKGKEAYTRSATELDEAGIRFARSKTTKLDDISFECGVLRLPQIDVDDALESEYLNMMALERLHWEKSSEVTSYVFLMDRLIDSAEDVSLLHWHHIIENTMGNDEVVAHLFNSLSREACLDQYNTLYEVQKDLTRYYRSPMRRCMAYAKHNYFKNTWVTLSIFAAIFIFSVTTVQTVYTILDYHRKGPN